MSIEEGHARGARLLAMIRRFCGACGSSEDLQEHHLVPRSIGGAGGPTVTLCASCHHRAHHLGHSIRNGDLQRAKTRGAVTIAEIEAELAAALGELPAIAQPGALTPLMVVRLRAPSTSGKQEIIWDQALEGFGVLISGRTNTKKYIVEVKRNGRRRLTIGPVNVINLDEARDTARSLLAKLAVEMN